MNPFIIPKPSELKIDENKFQLKDNFIVYLDTKLSLEHITDFITQHLLPPTGFHFQTETSNTDNAQFCFIYSDNIPNEGYELSLTTDKLLIKSSTPSGHFYGLITFMQLLPKEIFSDTKSSLDITWEAPCVTIKDSPKYSWRGMHLDCSRHFVTFENVKKFIYWMSLHKLNTFHWHLTDDQGWRFESKKYPKLTEVGSMITDDKGTVEGQFFYTQGQMKEIVEYAHKLCITVVPEIEMPGHCDAALKAYPDFCCKKELPEKSYWRRYMYNRCFCISNEKVIEFLKDILVEVIEIFDSKYIHIGGDEVLPGYWQICPDCQKLWAEKGFEDCEEYQAWFTKEIANFLNEKGRLMIGWDEIIQENLPNNTAIMIWRNHEIAQDAIEYNYPFVLVPNSCLYFDHNQFYSNDKDKYVYFGGMSTLKDVYIYDPLEGVSKPELILGIQACAWGEVMYDFNDVQWKVFPRICAMAETAWTNPELKDYKKFYEGLNKVHLARLEEMHINYAHK